MPPLSINLGQRSVNRRALTIERAAGLSEIAPVECHPPRSAIENAARLLAASAAAIQSEVRSAAVKGAGYES
jgi:hypothetical protein